MSFSDLFFSTRGRINRAMWWLGIICISIGAVIGALVLWSIFGAGIFLNAGGGFALFVLSIVANLIAYCVNARRFQDRGRAKSLAWVALALGTLSAVLDLLKFTGDPWVEGPGDTVLQFALAIVGLWYLVELGFFRGTRGVNAYGPDPLESEPAS